MDINELKRHSDLSFDRAVAKKNLLARAESELITVYQDHIFRADAVTIATVRALMESQDYFFILDSNSNPVKDRPSQRISRSADTATTISTEHLSSNLSISKITEGLA